MRVGHFLYISLPYVLHMQIEVDATVLYAAGRDNFRKPGTGMWDYFVENLNGGVSPGTHLLITPE